MSTGMNTLLMDEAGLNFRQEELTAQENGVRNFEITDDDVANMTLGDVLEDYRLTLEPKEEAVKRRHKLNEKGKDYKTSLLEAQRKRIAKNLIRSYGCIEDLLYSKDNLSAVKQEMVLFDELFKEVLSLQAEYDNTLSVEDYRLNEFDNWFDDVDATVLAFKEKIQAWIRKTENNMTRISGSSKGSITSQSSRSSRNSRRSNSSSVSVRMKAVEERAKIAELEASAKYLDEKIKATCNSAKLDLEEKIAKAKAREEVFKQESSDVEGNTDQVRKESEVERRYDGRHLEESYKFVTSRTEDKVKPSIEKQVYVNSSTDSLKLQDLMCSLLKRQSAPEIDIDVFDGNPLDYHYFKALFEEVVENKIDEPRGRLTRLIKFTRGEPKELIKHCIQQPPDIGYQSAKSILEKQYGDPFRIMSSYRREIRNWPEIKPGDSKEHRKFYNFLLKCQSLTKTNCNLNFDSPDTLCILLSKLPGYQRERWNRKVYNIRKFSKREPILSDLVSFVDEETTLTTDPLYSREGMLSFTDKVVNADKRPERPPFRQQRRPFKSCATNTDDSDKRGHQQSYTEKEKRYKNEDHVSKSCIVCGDKHNLDDCKIILKLDLEERSKLIARRKLCYGCLEAMTTDHNARTCQKRLKCKTCDQSHPTVLHGYRRRVRDDVSSAGSNKNSSESPIPQPKSFCTSTSVQHELLSMCIVPVNISCSSRGTYQTYAMLDSCSQGCFIKENLISDIGLSGIETTVAVKTLTGVDTFKTVAVDGLKVSDINNSTVPLPLPRVYSRHDLPVDSDEIVTPDKIRKWSYLDGIVPDLPHIPKEVGLLIGSNCLKGIEPIEFIPSRENGPYAFRTKLGLCVVGPLDSEKVCARLSCNLISVNQAPLNELATHCFASEVEIKDIGISSMFQQMYEAEFGEDKGSHLSKVYDESFEEISAEDRRFLKLMDNEVKQIGKHYQLPLPFKNNEILLPNNRSVAERRLFSLKKRLINDQRYCEEYKKFIEDLLMKGYARKAFKNETDGRCWYIPHHGVFNENKGKIRVVFDCSSEYQNKSLNKELMSGPDLTNHLLGVLLRFREESVAFMADIESMFHQVKVDEKHCSFLRFLWWENGDIQSQPIDFEFLVHIIGGTSSPACCNYALKKSMLDYELRNDKILPDKVKRGFYVDDLLQSVDTAESAKGLIKEAVAFCEQGGFRLTKFICNNLDVLESISDKDRRKGVKSHDMSFGTLHVEKALGIQWNVMKDQFEFKVTLKEKSLTRRGMLSVLSSIYDPVGFVSPFLLKGKRILQQLCYSSLGWDDKISIDQQRIWEEWKTNISQLENLHIDRCIKPLHFADNFEANLHHFSDASEEAYGQCSYLRLVDTNGKIHCSFMIGKSRVAPKKFVSIPRMELTAAVLSVKVSMQLKKEISFQISNEYFWTDSKVVLGYIFNETKKFKIFVANRIQFIHDNSAQKQWKYVPTENNPADYASRGLTMKMADKVKVWFEGPDYLWTKEACWQSESNKESYQVKSEDTEVKVINVRAIKESKYYHDIYQGLERTGDWSKLKRIVGLVLLYKKILYNKIKGISAEGMKLDVELLNLAETEILKLCQENSFHTERACLQSKYVNKIMHKSSHIFSLDPIINERGLLCVGGRLKRTAISNMIHPILLPKSSHVSTLIIKWCHEKTGHSGRGITLNEVRSNGFWVVNGNSAVKKLISNCIRCRKMRGKTCIQKMGDLPAERGEEAPPFTYVGLDMFGPFMVKNARKEIKRYGIIFTCLTSRAVHIEVVFDMGTDSFIQALRRFIARRGNIKLIRCDNGTNFVGCEKELQRAFLEMNDAKISFFLANLGTQWLTWKKNPPAASHMGGIWERQIRSIRNILTSLLKTHGTSLDDESLQTLLTETEAIINSRPLTVETLSDPTSSIPISPSNILTMKTKVVMPPPGRFERPDLYSRRRWRRIQHIADEFWRRWRHEYLSTLQVRQKWNEKKYNIEVNDIVLMKTDAHRNEWPMGRIMQTVPDRDGLVRVVKLKLANVETILTRPIHKIVLLPKHDNEHDKEHDSPTSEPVIGSR